MSLAVSPSLTFRTDVQLVHMLAKQARGRVSSSANQMSPPSALLNSLNELNGTTQRFSAPNHRVQCFLFTLRMLVVPPSSFTARFLVASISACCDDGIPLCVPRTLSGFIER